MATFAVQYRGVEQLVARRAHNPEVVGSSPASATNKKVSISLTFFCCLSSRWRWSKVLVVVQPKCWLLSSFPARSAKSCWTWPGVVL